MTRAPSVSVVVCTATHGRVGLLGECVDSLFAGARAPDEVLVVVDHNPSLAEELDGSLPRPVRLLHSHSHGLSEARNVGIRAASCDIVAFVDDDVTVDREWLPNVVDAFGDRRDFLGVGGPAVPRWGAERRWLSDELLWAVGCTYRGHREDPGPIRNPLGCNMAFRRRELVAVGGFASRFGKRGNALETCDETELALRLERAFGAGRIRFVPRAGVRHFVPESRISWRLILRRSLSEGLSKGRLYRLYGSAALGPERTYARGLVAKTVPRLLIDGVRRRDRRMVMSAAAILASLFVTAAAFSVGAARGRRGADRRTAETVARGEVVAP